jgi:hypothetical protein
MTIAVIFLFVCVLIIALVFAMFIILKNTVNKINTQTKSYFVDKLQEYDYLIDEKEDKLNQIDKEIKDKELSNKSDEKEIKKGSYEFDYNIINLLNEAKYQDKNAFELNKKLEKEFNIDYKKLISKFIDENTDSSNYEFCLNLKKKFNSTILYELKLLDNDKMNEKIKQLLTEQEYQIYESFASTVGKPTIDSFVDYLSELLDLNNPYITVYVGNKNDNYDNLSKYITTKYSKDIYKGIKIVYKNKIYDYSLNERNV